MSAITVLRAPLPGASADWFYRCYGIWTDADDTRHISWVKDTAKALRPWTTAGMALNFFTDVDDDRVRSAFGEEKYRRLVALKDRYDPDNVFRRNQNVRPSMAGADQSARAGSAEPSCRGLIASQVRAP